MRRQTPTGGLHPEITLPHVQEWELYQNSFSMCSKKVRVCLSELGIPYKSHHVHLIETGAYETVSRAYLKINPGGTVPVLLHDGHPVYESHEQIIYAADHTGERGRRLLPDEPEVKALVDRWVDCASLVGNPLQGFARRAGHCVPPLTLPIFATMMAYIPYREILKGLMTHPHKERPLLFLVLKLCGVRGLPRLFPLMKLLRQARAHLGDHLDALARQIESHGGPWIAGEQFTLADVSWVVILDRLVEADWDDYFWGESKRPTVSAYWDRLSSRPSYQSEILAVRCAATQKGILDLKRAKSVNDLLRVAFEV